jgi:hypothetical protein
MALHFRTVWRSEADDWTAEGPSIADGSKLDSIRQELEQRGPVIVEHWHYRGGRAPSRLVFDEFDDFRGYLEANAIAGDAIDVWAWATACPQEQRLAQGKCPGDDGKVPRKGPY